MHVNTGSTLDSPVRPTEKPARQSQVNYERGLFKQIPLAAHLFSTARRTTPQVDGSPPESPARQAITPTGAPRPTASASADDASPARADHENADCPHPAADWPPDNNVAIVRAGAVFFPTEVGRSVAPAPRQSRIIGTGNAFDHRRAPAGEGEKATRQRRISMFLGG